MFENLRQRINDSDAGSKLNNSCLGLAIEDLSLSAVEIGYKIRDKIEPIFLKLIYRLDPSLEMHLADYLDERRWRTFQKIYSKKSLLWRKLHFVLPYRTISGYERVSLDDAFERKLPISNFPNDRIIMLYQKTAQPSESVNPFFIPDYGTVNGVPKYMN